MLNKYIMNFRKKEADIIKLWVALVKQVVDYDTNIHEEWFIDDYLLASTIFKNEFYDKYKSQQS
jgi:hypothetical protein